MGDGKLRGNPYRGRKSALHRVTIKCTIDTFVQPGGDHVWSPTGAIYRIYTCIYVHLRIYVHMRMWAGCVHLEFGVPIWAPGISRNSCIIYVLEASPEYDELYPRCRNMHIPAALLEKRVRSSICLFWDVECRPLRARPRTPCAGAENGSELKGYSRLHFWGHEITADARDLAHPRGRPGVRIPTIRQSRQAALLGSGGVRNGVPKQGISPCPECATPPIYPLNSRV